MSTENNIDTSNDVDLDTFSAEFFGQNPVENPDSSTNEEGEGEEIDTTDSDAPLEEQENEDTHDDGDDTPAPDESDEEEEDEDEEEGDEPEPKAKPKNRFQERINELTGKARSAEREAAELRDRLAQLEQKISNPTPPETTKVAVESGEPDPEAKNEDGTDKYPLGQFDAQYQADLVRHFMKVEREQVMQEEARKAEQRASQQASEALQAEWNEKLAPAQERYPDFLEKATEFVDTFSGLDPAYGDYLGNVIKSMDYGTDVLYYLANNPEQAKAIVSSGAQKATIALGRLESQFIVDEEEPPVRAKVTKAPKPPKVMNKGSSVSRGSVAPDTDDLDAFAAEFFKKGRK